MALHVGPADPIGQAAVTEAILSTRRCQAVAPASAAVEVSGRDRMKSSENFEAMQGFHAGWRKSGIGGADGRHGLYEFLQTHVVYMQKQ